MSVAKDTTVAKAFSILTPNALMEEIKRNPVTSAAISLSAVTELRSWEKHEITTRYLVGSYAMKQNLWSPELEYKKYPNTIFSYSHGFEKAWLSDSWIMGSGGYLMHLEYLVLLYKALISTCA